VRRSLQARSVTPFATELLAGPRLDGIGLGHGYVLFGDRVLALTPPGAFRMPNGVETELVVARGESVTIGDGVLATPSTLVTPGPVWEPRPTARVALALQPPPRVELETLAGRGPGLTPLGDDILIGYAAAHALSGNDAAAVAVRAARRTTSLSRTLLRLAAQGALPEAAHRLLVDGDPEPLLAFGATSGKGIAFGLALLRSAGDLDDARPVRLGRFELLVAVHAELRARDVSYRRPEP
jgi:hypothetical protein